MGYKLTDLRTGTAHYNDVQWLLSRVENMKRLLEEWQGTEFFADKEKWACWVRDFGGRVMQELVKLEE